MKKFLARIAVRWLFLLCYFVGLTALIPYIIASKVPSSIFIFTIPPVTLLIISILLISISVIGMYFLKGDIKDAMRALAWSTIFPVIIAMFVLLFGDNIIMGLIAKFEYLKPVFEYMLKGIPHTLYLIISYLIIATIWFTLSTRKH